ncbi:cytochrome c oxidase assembly protein COX11, mitochondrial-like [Lytechinus pictus]|uniref:cytochrome c oxidase assembly protein COX11, mitochondrial-like n=1 Tax=Lytechinus pictus TaxID=7653 RepID=UPI0030B9E075
MIRVISNQLNGLSRATSSLSIPWQQNLFKGNLLQGTSHLKSSDHHFLSTKATASLHRSLLTSHRWCSRTEAKTFRISQGTLKLLSQFGGTHLHTSSSLDHTGIISRLTRPYIVTYNFTCRNCDRNVRSPFVPGTVRLKSSHSRSQQNAWRERNKSVMLYVIAGAVLVVGFSYAAVPLYTVFCQATGLGGQATAGHDIEKVETMAPVRGRELVIRFNADTAASMRWNFRPQQTEVKVVPGETALAFYSAMNPTNKPIVGISTYNVVPFDAGQYFNKIQCFCFEEQRLNPHEQVDMPVFFYIDPDFDEDPKMAKVTNITLSYTFFESKEGLELPDPWSRPE